MGCALAGTVLLVLIAYLVGRRNILLLKFFFGGGDGPVSLCKWFKSNRFDEINEHSIHSLWVIFGNVRVIVNSPFYLCRSHFSCHFASTFSNSINVLQEKPSSRVPVGLDSTDIPAFRPRKAMWFFIQPNGDV